MKSFNTLELCIENNKNNNFIFKQTALNKMYSYSDLDTIKKFQKKHKCNLYEYVNSLRDKKLSQSQLDSLRLIGLKTSLLRKSNLNLNSINSTNNQNT